MKTTKHYYESTAIYILRLFAINPWTHHRQLIDARAYTDERKMQGDIRRLQDVYEVEIETERTV